MTSCPPLVGSTQYVPYDNVPDNPLLRIFPATCSTSSRPSHRGWINGKGRYCSGRVDQRHAMGGIPCTILTPTMPHPPCIPALPFRDTGEHSGIYHVLGVSQCREPLPMVIATCMFCFTSIGTQHRSSCISLRSFGFTVPTVRRKEADHLGALDYRPELSSQL